MDLIRRNDFVASTGTPAAPLSHRFSFSNLASASLRHHIVFTFGG
ncbi:hypothetical protein [Emticicia aquatilis]|nr:hypothetical protein [Emticicia aquatilis]